MSTKVHQAQRDRLVIDPLEVCNVQRFELGGDLGIVHRVHRFELAGELRPIEQDPRAVGCGVRGKSPPQIGFILHIGGRVG